MNKIINKTVITTLIAAALSTGAFASDNNHNVISTENIEWGMLNPARGDASPKAADLFGDRTKNMATGMLVKFEKGFSSPEHIHNITYRGIVIEGLMHNDDPSAEKMWLKPGSFWTQPAGEAHITAANGMSNLIYLEIDSGPYLVHPSSEAFDNGERPINIESSNITWVDPSATTWVKSGDVHLSYLWGDTNDTHGTFVRFPANFEGYVETNETEFKSVVVNGSAEYKFNNEEETTSLTASSFFSSKIKSNHHITTGDDGLLIYVNTTGSFNIK